MSFFEWPLKTGIQLSLMGIQFENFSLKNKFLTDRPIPVKQGRVRGNKNIFTVGPYSKNLGQSRDKYKNGQSTLY